MKRRSDRCLEEELAKKHACYILITCDAAAEDDGKMHVEMSYQGDATLAAYLLKGAQLRLDEQEFDFDVSLQKKVHCFES